MGALRGPADLRLSGERFRVVYAILGDPETAARRAEAICVEQTVEFPPDLLPEGPIPEQIVARIEAQAEIAPGRSRVTLSYAVETAGDELTQLVNVAFGNSSLLPGLRLERLELPEGLTSKYRGPRFGREGLRALLAVPRRPLVATALKPMGLGPRSLAELAHAYALGGVDLLKDDHGLADQPFCPFEERVTRAAAAVAEANAKTGGRTLYFANVTAPADRLVDRAYFAREAGAGGVMLAPGLTGFDALRRLADDDGFALPILGHPALLGSYTVSAGSGISPFALYGQLHRLAGADAVIFPNHGGRFSFSPEDCHAIAEGAAAPFGRLAASFPVPAGGMSLGRVAEMRAFYGEDVILLIGGDLHRHPDGVTAACRELVARVSAPPG